MDIEFSIEGEKQFSRRLLIVADGVTDFTTPLEEIGSELQKTFQLNFGQEGGLFGGWAPRKDNNPWPILDKSGLMKSSFEQKVDGNSLILFNPVPYFKYHQSNKPRTRLPRRVMMRIDNERKEFIVKAFQKYLVSLIRGK